MSEFKVVCGTCQSDIAIIADPGGEAAVCVMCGQQDDLKDAQRIAGEHFLHQMIPDLQKSIANVAANDYIRFTPKRQQSRSYRWHAAPLDTESE